MKITKVNISKRLKITSCVELHHTNLLLFDIYVSGFWQCWEEDMKNKLAIGSRNSYNDVWFRY